MDDITAIDLKEKMDHQEVILVDVRQPEEYAVECIEGSHLMPLADLFFKDLPAQNLPIVFYCAVGRRSQEACRRIQMQDDTLTVSSLEGGIAAWKRHGFPVKKGNSIER